MGKFIIKETSTGYVFHLKAKNGEVIGTSEVYTTLTACENGISSVKKNAPVANVEDQTLEESAKNPKFVIFKDKADEFRFHLKATNGEIILDSEGYASKEGCKNGMESVIKNAPDADIEK